MFYPQWVIRCCVCYLFNFISASVLRTNDLYRLDIVHYNDFHDRFEETSDKYPICQSNDTNCLGGFARLYQEIHTLLEEKPNALLLNAGDTFQGTYWYTLLKWNVTQHFINMLPNDAHAIGNHEFDDGVAGLVPYLAALQAPVLIANIDTSREPTLNELYKPHIIVERQGRKIGIIGLITVDTALLSNAGNVVFLDPVKVAEDEAQSLTEQGVDIIIVLSHCGLDIDKKIAKKVGHNIDIIVGGHSHSLLWNGKSPNKSDVSGPYPVIVEAKSSPGHKVVVVTASAFSKYLGNISVYFDKQGEVQFFDGDPVFLNRSIPENPEMKALLEPYKNNLHQMVQDVVGYTTNDMLARSCGFGECEIGNLIADAYLNATKEAVTSNLTNVVFVLRNMIRGSMAKGEINRGSIINVSPFTNKVVTFVLSGRYLLEALNRCLTNWWEKNPFAGPWIPQISGLRVTLDVKLQQAVSVLVKEGDEFVPLDLNKDYQVTSLDFLTRGGNGFQMIKEFGRDFKVIGKDATVIENYIKKISPITPKLDNRLTVIN